MPSVLAPTDWGLPPSLLHSAGGPATPSPGSLPELPGRGAPGLPVIIAFIAPTRNHTHTWVFPTRLGTPGGRHRRHHPAACCAPVGAPGRSRPLRLWVTLGWDKVSAPRMPAPGYNQYQTSLSL